MKTNQLSWIMGAVIALNLVNAGQAYADHVVPPKLVTLAPEKVFAPPGFDDNDNAQITVFGMLPDTCFKTGQATAKIDQANHKIVIRNEVFKYQGEWCLFVLIPFTQTVSVGTLEQGNYQILVENQRGGLEAKANMPIAHARNSGPDDEMYAVIDSAHIEKIAENRARLQLTGSLTSTCMHFKEVKTLYRAQNIIEVLPVVEMDQDRECTPVLQPWETKVEINYPWKGESLIHVRSLNGQALNRVVNLDG